MRLIGTCIIVATLFLAGVLCATRQVRADNDLHDQNNLSNADYCAACHRAHTADTSRLLLGATDQASFCYTCHGTGQIGANTNVQDGEYSDGSGLRGGGFANAVMDPNLTGTPSSAPVTSAHSVDNSVARSWGGGPISGTPDYGNMLNLECGDCHNPHGNGNYRILRGNPDGMYEEGTATVVDVPDESSPVYNITYNETTHYRSTSYVPGELNNWCAQCHTRYSAGTGGGHTDSGDAIFAFRHNTSSLSGKCLRCHMAHGTTATMGTYSGAVALPDGTSGSGANNSRLLSSSNRAVCAECHISDGQVSGHGSGGDCAACHGTSGSHATHTVSNSKGPSSPLACTDCHDEGNYSLFADGESLAATVVCNSCHSPSGTYNGVISTGASIGAKTNWWSEIYSGNAIKSGKEKWCAGCHDDVPAYSRQLLCQAIVDNPEAAVAGSWSTSTSSSEQYGDSVYYKTAGDGSATVTWTPNLTFAGDYAVYVWWTTHSNRVTDAPYTINYEGGSETVDVNQETNGGQWNYLTAKYMSSGSRQVKLSCWATSGYVAIADAIKWYK